ncbi:MAG: proline--tRNA ligase [Lachnospiraceae bacterium]|nr:proline--tRNA ligase [Lachnospiraceae bacterium]
MAKEKKLVESITSRDVDFAQWYTDVVKKAELCDYSAVKGCFNYLPNGYALWERIMGDLDGRFKAYGVKNVSLPVLIPESLLEVEADHVEGFAPEVAWVTHGGMERLQERLCVRPTSEVLFCDLWRKVVKSYRDLPKIWNQWNTVLRWEKTSRPFLRSREFMWQEGHTLHATYEEAENLTLDMLHIYEDCYRDALAIPFVSGRKAEHEKFAGAQDTYTIEALMYDGRALQSATSHFFGNKFPDAFGIKYVDKNNEYQSCYETSWGFSARSIGGIIMVHGDDSGLVLPPRIAPIECRVIPVASHKEGVTEKAFALVEELKKAGYRVDIDDSDKSPGWKFADQEMVGIPTRIEIGPKEIESGKLIVVRRDTRERIEVAAAEITVKLHEITEQIHHDMYAKAEKFLKDHIYEATNIEDMKAKFQESRGFVKACWCGDPECEGEVKYVTGGAGTRCLIEDEEFISDTCIWCGKPAKHMVYWGKAY